MLTESKLKPNKVESKTFIRSYDIQELRNVYDGSKVEPGGRMSYCTGGVGHALDYRPEGRHSPHYNK